MNVKKFMLPVMLIIALSTIGLTYAHWSETIFIYGHVETGDVDAAIVTWFSDDPQVTIDPSYDKHVATTTCWIDQNDPHIAYVTIEDAYPSYLVRFTCDIENTGTIPWHMQTPKVNDVQLEDFVWVDFDLDGDGLLDVNIMYINGEEKQVHPGGAVEWSMRIHVKQTAHQDFTYQFTVSVEVLQWNLVP